MNRSFNLELRLIAFAVEVINFVDNLPHTISADHLGKQLLRSATSPALNYGEAKGAESKKDFVHKMKICLKELRESHNNLQILWSIKLGNTEKCGMLINECDQLIAIFVASILTALRNNTQS